MVCACLVFTIKHERGVIVCGRLAGYTVVDFIQKFKTHLTSVATTAVYSDMPSYLVSALMGSSFV